MKNKPCIINTKSTDQTFALGQKLAPYLTTGDFLALSGSLGAGKTCFVQGLCAGLGVHDYVNSPTFTLINIYKGRLPVYHFDLYRLADSLEIETLGYEEYFWGDGVTCVEWAEKAANFFPSQRIMLNFSYVDANSRQINFSVTAELEARFADFIDELQRMEPSQ